MAKHKAPKGAGFNDFSFRKSKPAPVKKALPTFTVGDIQPKPGWCLVEQVKPEPLPDEEKSPIITHGAVRAPDGQRVVVSMHRPQDEQGVGKMMQDETWRIIATGSDFIPNGDSPEPFPFRVGDECIVSMHGASTAHGLQYPDDKGDEDERPTRFLVQMMYVIGRVTRAEHMSEVHGDDG